MTFAADVAQAHPAEPRAWLLLVAGDDRQHGGNDGYLDMADAHYSWDNTVPNHAELAPGDRIALWDKHRLLGASLIERIVVSRSEKILRKCPHCGRAHIKARKTVSPRYRCFGCSQNFNDPTISMKLVDTYQSDHAAAWSDLAGRLTGEQLRVLCHSPRSQLSMRQLDWTRFEDALANGTATGLGALAERAEVLAGHRTATVRARVGQAAFRDRVLSRFGSICAITGPAPDAALEAAHLYSYAALGIHHEHGGLPMRRDVHRLFDSGQITIDPETLQIDVSSNLRNFSQYAALQGRSPAVTVSDGHRSWLRLHWMQHRS